MRHDPLADPAPLIRRVYAYVAYRIGEGADAQDVTSEVFERALRYRASYDPARGQPLAWLLGIARRCADDALSAHQPLSLPEFDEQPSTLDLDGEVLERLVLGTAIAALDERSRDLLALRFGAELSAKQIGEVLGMTAIGVRVALHRTLGRLREALAENEGEPQTTAVVAGASSNRLGAEL